MINEITHETTAGVEQSKTDPAFAVERSRQRWLVGAVVVVAGLAVSGAGVASAVGNDAPRGNATVSAAGGQPSIEEGVEGCIVGMTASQRLVQFYIDAALAERAMLDEVQDGGEPVSMTASQRRVQFYIDAALAERAVIEEILCR